MKTVAEMQVLLLKSQNMNVNETIEAADKLLTAQASNQDSALESMILEGGIIRAYWQHWGNGMSAEKGQGGFKYQQLALEKKCRRVPEKRYQSLCVRLSWLVLQGIDVTPFANETYFKPFVQKTVAVGKNGACSWEQLRDDDGKELTETVEERVKLANNGKLELTIDGAKKTCGIGDLTGLALWHAFGGENPNKVKPFAITWSFSSLEDKGKPAVKSALKTWLKKLQTDAPEIFNTLYSVIKPMDTVGKAEQNVEKTPKQKRNKLPALPTEKETDTTVNA